MHVSTIVFHLQQVIDLYIRLFDLVTSGTFKFYDPDLAIINEALNNEFQRWIDELNKQKGKDFVKSFVPFQDVKDLNVVYENWKNQRIELGKLKFKVQMAFELTGAPSSLELTSECLAFTREVGKMIGSYESKKDKFEVQQFSNLYLQFEKNKKEQDKLNEFFNIDFLSNKEVKIVLAQFFEEFKSSFFSKCIRAPIILCGALVEALLIEAISVDEDNAIKAYKEVNNGKEKAIDQWRFEELIDIAIKIGIIHKDLENQTDVLRTLRNFIHIHKAVKSGIQLDDHFKDLCKNAFFIVLNEVRKWYESKV